MSGIGSTTTKLRETAERAFVASATPARGSAYPDEGLSGSSALLAKFVAGLAIPDGRTPQQALYDFRAPVAVLECSLRNDSSRPPSEEGAKLLKAAIRDSRHEVAAMLLHLHGMDPNQLMDDDKGNTLLTAAISSKDHSLTLLLLKQPGINVRRANAAGQTPIALAMRGFYIHVGVRVHLTLVLHSHAGDDHSMRVTALVELLNTYHSHGHSYSDVVTEDLAQFKRADNVAWVLSWGGVIQDCAFFLGPLSQLQVEHLNRPHQDCHTPMPAILAAAESGYIETVVFLLSLRNVGLDLHAQVSNCLCTHQSMSEARVHEDPVHVD